MIDFNGSRAAREAGFKGTSMAWNLLRENDVREEINRRIAEKRAKARITIEEIESMLRDIAEVEVLDIFTEDGEVRPLVEIPPHARRAIKSVKRTVKEHYITGAQEEKVELELWDKKGAIELLGRYKKMFSDKLDVDVNLRQKVSFTINGLDEEGQE